MSERAPSRRLERWAERIDRLSRWVGHAVAWLTLAMVLVTFAIVVLRYGFDVGWIAMQESVVYMHAVVFMLGAAYTLQADEHVRVDIFYRGLPPRRRAWIDLLGTVLFLWPLCGAVVWFSWDYVAAAWAVREGSREPGGLPWVYLLKSLIPALAVLLAVQGAATVLRSLRLLSDAGKGSEA
jgi:TRAP-type mannitol/chloroaromatic compound transport system permease small subunit